ncbi:MAG: UDP-3-O-(3-hydroxymyristoyl)glucosamine N-acyltransferase [Candidatus Puniceispirillaceae bacterium]
MAINSAFHPVVRQITAQQAADLTGAEIARGDEALLITHAASYAEASKNAVLFIGNHAYLSELQNADDTIIITTAKLQDKCPETATILIADNPRLAFAKITAYLYQGANTPTIDATAHIHETAKIGKNVSIGAFAIIHEHVVIGDNSVIGAHTIINAQTSIGADCKIGHHCVLECTIIGNSVSIAAQSVIGKAGFGFEMTQDGAVMLPHLGLVEIADNVTIGSQTVIDRGVLGNTTIGRDVMIDNHVHIAHNVTIGDKTIILAQVGIAGSSNIGCNAIIGGQVGIKDHVEIADNVMVLSGSKVTKSLEKAGAYAGFPAQPAKQHWREMAQLKQLLSQKKSGE